ncbi:MAG: hypothetical protein JO323_12295 [Acidobacteriia bacterium]|nr:hypothetical protein [Terriglobia bacterium]
MQISSEALSKHYASLSDTELLAIDPSELTEAAQQCYDRELARRNLPDQAANLSEEVEPDDPSPAIDATYDIQSDWLPAAATACSFSIGPTPRYSEEAARACAILRRAGIPSQVISDADAGEAATSISVMVPGALSLKASSVLDREWFNEEMEETWRNHFAELADEELRVLQADDICAGLIDRAARLKRVFKEALDRRRSGTRE